MTKSPRSLLLALVLAASALPSLAQHPTSSAAGNQPAGSQPAPTPATPATPATAVPQTSVKVDSAAGGAKYDAVCASCHGAGGNSGTPANPKLAQQHPEYIVKQLQEFKSGKRPSPIMQGFAAQLTDADMKNIGAYVGSQAAKPGFARDKDLVASGEKIYRGGIANKQVAACAGCHSPNGAGVPSQYPRLGGQHADYTASQLTAFRDGARKNSAQMNAIAAKMNDREIRAVADYIAGLR